MAFRELTAGVKRALPQGASERYVKLEALGRQLDGTLYDHLKFSFEDEKYNGKHVNLRERRPSVDFNLAHEITQDTLAELFGDEQFPTVNVMSADGAENDEDATEALRELIDDIGLDATCVEAYEEGVVGSCAIVLHNDGGRPFYEVLPGKWCKPAYRGRWSNELIALVVTYPVGRKQVEREFPEVVKEDPDENYWYRYIVGPFDIADYLPMSDRRYQRLGEDEGRGTAIEFREYERTAHGFNGRVPAVYTKNLGGSTRNDDGMCLWWPIRNICVEVDYTLSQAGRGLRYCADPMIFIKRGDLMDQMDVTRGRDGRAMGQMATTLGAGGQPVRGATQVLVGGKDSDAKILEISANGIKEEREYVRDLREYALEVIGGQKARAQQMSDAASGKAIDKGTKPLRRLVRRQRNPYGKGMLLSVIDLTLYGYYIGVFDAAVLDNADVAAIPLERARVLEWPKDEVLQGQDLLFHVQAMEMAAGGSAMTPKELISTEAIGAQLASDMGFHQSYASIEGDAAEKDDLAMESSKATLENLKNPPEPNGPPSK